ncbi:MAG: DUF937 domain-containing protein [Hyphomicrobiaceae bacterium]
MNINKLIDSTPGASPVRNLSTAFGVDPTRAEPAVDMLAQSLADRIERNTLSRGGIADVFDLLARPEAGVALNEPQALASEHVEEVGNGILDVLLGSKHISRGLAAKAARESGLSEETLKKMLPAVASMVIGALQNKTMPQIEKAMHAMPAIPGSPLPLPGEPRGSIPQNHPNLPQTAGGGRSGGTAGRSPLPLPGDDIPGIEGPSRFPQIPDIIRKGGRQIQVPGPTGGSLDEIIRQILANVLGFKNSGVLAWILKIIFSRWFLGLLSRILFRRK